MLYGRTNASLPSRFLREIPENITVKKGGVQSPSYASVNLYSGSQPKKPLGTTYSRETTASSATKVNVPDVNKGDMVQHTAFGKGMVLSVMKMGGDALLEIAFDQIGTKKLMAKTAFAHMKKL